VPVTVVAVGAGLSYAGLGPTHHACEDIAFLRAIPNMTVICPADQMEVKAAMAAVLKQDGPAYIRLGKKGEPQVHKEPLKDFAIGKAIRVSEGSDVCLLSCGTMLPEAVEAAKHLGEHGLSAEVMSFHTVKPLDAETLRRAFAKFRLVATIEEHSLIGGFGSAVAEWMVDNKVTPQNFLRFGTPDAFFKYSGEQEYAREQLGLTGHQIAEKIQQELRSKGD
jgi:transketolase